MKLNGELEYGDRTRLVVKYPNFPLSDIIKQHSVGTIIGKDPSHINCYLVNFSEISSELTSVKVHNADLVFKRPDKIGIGLRKLICELTSLEKSYRKLNNYEKNRNRRYY